MDTIELLAQGYAWTAARIAAVPADDLDVPTPCSGWNLQDLLSHTIGVVTMLTDAVATTAADADSDAPVVRVLGSTPWDRAIAEQAARSRRAWDAPGVMDRTFDLPIGTQSAPMLASISLLEVVVHGWDISQATGEAAEIPDALALPVLQFARQALNDANRGDNFAADIGIGDTATDQLVAFLGRKQP
ncbi:MAG: hypothetical protein JWL83_3019 [Actinomycetia bacterium]|nr:hypothetical protein [Actinomycetes bacterium]